jgi:tRNA modification GTPase
VETPPVTDTIAAIATPSGRGGVGIVRLSGPNAATIAEAIAGPMPVPRKAAYRRFRDTAGRNIDDGLLLHFPAPHSFTGEDVVELHGHGGPVVMDLLLRAVLEHGARLARAGEFSERAFLNGKLDLAQAEAVADLIDAGSEQAARAALRSLEGEFSARIDALAEGVFELRIYIEAALDFSDEDIDFIADGAVAERLHDLVRRLDDIERSARQGSRLREGLHVVIAGRPNVGKSSLLNRLARRESAIVTDIPGTTRDVLREHIHLDGLPLHVIDTAGLRDAADPVEREGVRRAWAEIERADLLLLVLDATTGEGEDERAILARLPQRLPRVAVYNKCDLTGEPPGVDGDDVRLSAKTGSGIEALVGELKRRAGFASDFEDSFIARRRHLDALARTREALERAQERLQEGNPELVAEELRLAHDALGEITGRVSSDALLGGIFASFCIGK